MMEARDVLNPYCGVDCYVLDTMPNKQIIGICDNYEVLSKSCDNE